MKPNDLPADIAEQVEGRTNTTADVLRRARALIDTPEKWAQGEHCVGDALCVEGAMWRAVGFTGKFEPGSGVREYGPMRDDWYRAEGVFKKSVGMSSYRWNDAPGRTHAEVLAAFDRAIELAKRG